MKYGGDEVQSYALTSALDGGHDHLLICRQGTGLHVPRPGPGSTDRRVRASSGPSSNDTNKTSCNRFRGSSGRSLFHAKKKLFVVALISC
jgi:hypothetical protein